MKLVLKGVELMEAKGGELEKSGARVKGQDPRETDNLQLPTRHIAGSGMLIDLRRLPPHFPLTKCQTPSCNDKAEYRAKNPFNGLPDLLLCGSHLKELEGLVTKLAEALNKSEVWVKAQESIQR